ncbi:MAG: class I SAM-dependent methyltransferase [Rubrimonas sp.]
MSFSAEWLTLRAPADAAARDGALVRRLTRWAAERPGLTVSDIGAGSGATLRALHGALPGATWRLIDRDEALLALAAQSAADLGAVARPFSLDLAQDPAAAVREGTALVTASAFFDLASAEWIDAFAAEAARAGAAVYAALNYDGRETWLPPHPQDAAILSAFLSDMRRDKGLGPALGADAGAHLAERLRALGYRVAVADSPWRLSSRSDAALIAALADGIAAATAAPEEWRAARRAADSALIGHIDILALPG